MLADVILPIPLSDIFTYVVPAEMEHALGCGFRVIVPFGTRKYYTGIVVALHDKPFSADLHLKEIYALIDSFPLVNEKQLDLWKWMAFYYLSPIGDVYKAAFPSKLRMESETFVSLSSSMMGENVNLTPTEKKIIEYLRGVEYEKISRLEKILDIKNIYPHIYSLSGKGLIETNQQIEQKFVPKIESFIRLNSEIDSNSIGSIIGKSKKQLALFEEISTILSESKTDKINRRDVLKLPDASPSVLKGLLQKNVLNQISVEVGRLTSKSEIKTHRPFPLNEFQQQALKEIESVFESKETCLLHGVTSSGKTEIYIHLIDKLIAKNQQILYLLPEIALTTQLMQRLSAVFGDKLGIYHSKLNDNERAEIWQKMLSDKPYDIILGVRSSLFLPFRNLGLIIIDEEHEQSYKQQEPAPRYHARDTGIMLAHLFGAKTLLGSATPSIESYYNAKAGKYGIVSLSKRFEEIEMPEIIIENTKELRRKKKMKSLLSPALIESIHHALSNNEQVILFRNRRGFAPIVECNLCAWTPKCKHCDVPLTYHKFRNVLVCHYCNATYAMPSECPSCHEKSIDLLGQGTEQLEEEVSRLFPEAKVARMDTDTTRGKNSYEKIIDDFEKNRVQILVGTQMLSKGLDFGNVSVVGIISADSLLNYPDFRSYERGFQLMTQAAGRSGRKSKQGKVIIQSNDPDQPIYRYIAENDYESFFASQLSERKIFKYPPFYRLISIVIKDKNESKADEASRYLADLLKSSLGDRVSGPNKPVIGKVQTYYIRNILLKTEIGLSPQKIRTLVKQAETILRDNQRFKYITLYYDVDPA